MSLAWYSQKHPATRWFHPTPTFATAFAVIFGFITFLSIPRRSGHPNTFALLFGTASAVVYGLMFGGWLGNKAYQIQVTRWRQGQGIKAPEPPRLHKKNNIHKELLELRQYRDDFVLSFVMFNLIILFLLTLFIIDPDLNVNLIPSFLRHHHTTPTSDPNSLQNPVGVVFLSVFGIIVVVQVVCMIITLLRAWLVGIVSYTPTLRRTESLMSTIRPHNDSRRPPRSILSNTAAQVRLRFTSGV